METREYIALVNSISRFERKIGQVRVLGFKSMISLSVRVKWRSSSFRSSVENAKNTNSAPCVVGCKEPVRVSRQNLDLPCPTPGNVFCRIITCNTRWNNATNSSSKTKNKSHVLGKDRIGIHITPTT